jgi:poly-gamma-glutamate synthesis protein (capsule biosynthesis protein)
LKNQSLKAGLILALFLALEVSAQELPNSGSLSLIFIGDIMGHIPQTESAYDPASHRYCFDSVFENVSPVIKKADFAIANLEVTLAGQPYVGYPIFSSPDELAAACKNSGINILTTANNHSFDRGKHGIIRTIKTLDSLGISHTGTFLDSLHREEINMLILEKNSIRVGLLNYTYGINGILPQTPVIVNQIQKQAMLADINKSKNYNLDKLIVFLHWGNEYQSEPSENQKEIARFLFENGADIIIGSHPHVVQRMEYSKADSINRERLIAYSLGNFVSDQRTSPRDGGVMVELCLSKENDKVEIKNCGYYLTWVNKKRTNNKRKYVVLLCSEMEAKNYEGMDSYSKNKMKVFINDSRTLFAKGNRSVNEIRIEPNQYDEFSPRPEPMKVLSKRLEFLPVSPQPGLRLF